jgi:uncharacterized protein with ParB-like and HNH nuclease domain
MTKEELQELIESKKNSLKTERLDMSFGEIISMYGREELIIDPEYQRLFRWSVEQQTRFIESILLGIPIPPIFVAENKDGKWEIVDGLQRVSTILSFFGSLKTLPDKNNWSLTEGDLIKDLKGYKYEQLTSKIQLNIKRFVCRIEILNWNSKIDVRYELFNRLNTGGTQLSDQEIRNCIFRGTSSKINDYFKEIASNKDFIDLISIPDSQIEELYLEELVLRFSSLYDGWEQVETSINFFMTDFMKNAVENNSFNIEIHKNLLLRTVAAIKEFGSKIFRFEKAGFSTSLYDAIILGVSKNIDFYEANKDEIGVRTEKLKKDPEFRKYTGSAANSQYRVKKRIENALKIFCLS